MYYPRSGERADSYEFVLSFGGDGTMLDGAREALAADCPLLGINLGTLGFLTEGNPEQLGTLLHSLLEGNYRIEKRGLLEIRAEGTRDKWVALNDAVVTRGGFARMIQIETRINGEIWDTFIADGVLAATPTGSTGYSLSAGGPILAPGVEGIVVTPVCAHSLRHSPCVVPPDSKIEFRMKTERSHRAELQVDGRSCRTMEAGEAVVVTGAGQHLKLVRIGEYHFFELMTQKFMAWSQPGREEKQP
ncbi:MAG: NAD(+)/NADH kinase [Clostridia bacterium]|nr:NAD(+)/NADH kinase [Clostridia bacterium]